MKVLPFRWIRCHFCEKRDSPLTVYVPFVVQNRYSQTGLLQKLPKLETLAVLIIALG